MNVLRQIAIVLITICGLAATAWLAMWIPFLLEMREHEQYVETVFMPFAELHADFLYNGFGVFILEFKSYSDLSDENVERLLLLNELPQKYDLNVFIETPKVTDASVGTLAKLKSLDALFVDKSGMTPEGIAQLESLLPPGTVSHYIWERADNGEDAPERANKASLERESLSSAE